MHPGLSGASPIPVLLLFGPTASGKTEVLEKLFAGPEAPFDGEVVSADSMQIYQCMDIGTAKPSRELLKHLPHHLIDTHDIREQFNVGDFVHLADAACVDIAGRGKLPVISGGTAFYFKNFLLGLPASPPSDEGIRRKLKSELEELGADHLKERLARADPVSADRIHVNDHYRLLRALEVYEASGKPLSSFPSSGSSPEWDTHGMARPEYRPLLVGLSLPREELYRRINHRTARMFIEGLAEEVQALLQAGYGPGDPGFRAIGYREFFDERGEYIEDLGLVEERIARNSRRYAKRQQLFFSSLPEVNWIDAEGDSGPLKAIFQVLSTFLSLYRAKMKPLTFYGD